MLLFKDIELGNPTLTPPRDDIQPEKISTNNAVKNTILFLDIFLVADYLIIKTFSIGYDATPFNKPF